eukprot:4527921-Prorocentrum_lima.AAC.1
MDPRVGGWLRRKTCSGPAGKRGIRQSIQATRQPAGGQGETDRVRGFRGRAAWERNPRPWVIVRGGD